MPDEEKVFSTECDHAQGAFATIVCCLEVSMFLVRRFGMLGVVALLASVGLQNSSAEEHERGEISTVFVIAMENHNWTQPANQFSGSIQQIFQNPNAPFINSLVDGSAYAVVDGRLVTGQNPASSTVAAKELLKVVAAQRERAA